MLIFSNAYEAKLKARAEEWKRECARVKRERDNSDDYYANWEKDGSPAYRPRSTNNEKNKNEDEGR